MQSSDVLERNGAGTYARAKTRALIALATISFVVPMIEVAVTGHAAPYGKFAITQMLLFAPATYYWYHSDKSERFYRASAVLNVGIIFAPYLAFPYYFLRTRGWRRGALSIAKGIAALVALGLIDGAGEAVGLVFAR